VTDDLLGAPVVPTASSPGRAPRTRLVGWTILVTILAALSYAANLAGGDTPDDVLYQWSAAIGGVVQYAIILAVVLLLSRGIAPQALGLQRPASWQRAAGWIVAGLVAIWVIGAILNIFLKAGEEQGLVPDSWDSSRAAPFVANFVVVAAVAPVVEELTYRGLGFAALRDARGATAAVVLTALAFGLAHGLVVALPVLTTFGVILAWLRWKTESLYPTIILHAVFNGAALIAAVTV
jgi:membrane protease YdiL (CAAX protease family)